MFWLNRWAKASQAWVLGIQTFHNLVLPMQMNYISRDHTSLPIKAPF